MGGQARGARPSNLGKVAPVRTATIDVPANAIEDLRARLASTRWFDWAEGSGWAYGTDIDYLRGLCAYWESGFDWAAIQERLNSFGQVETFVDGQRIHAFHVRSPRSDATPLLLVHGWPGSVLEFIDVLAPLSDPDGHGCQGGPAFHVVCPSIPGYGFSGPTRVPGWNLRRISGAFDGLMDELGYHAYAAAGGDWGANIATDLARSDRAHHLTGLHLTMPMGVAPLDDARPDLDPFERTGLDDWARSLATGVVNHVATNSHRPHTMALAMNDSPAGLACWLVDMIRSFTVGDGDVEEALTRDQLLANASVYWFTGTIASACRLYWEWRVQKAAQPDPPFVSTPTSVAVFPSDVRRLPRSWSEPLYNIVDWQVMPAGGHFASWEQPEAFVSSLRSGLSRG